MKLHIFFNLVNRVLLLACFVSSQVHGMTGGGTFRILTKTRSFALRAAPALGTAPYANQSSKLTNPFNHHHNSHGKAQKFEYSKFLLATAALSLESDDDDEKDTNQNGRRPLPKLTEEEQRIQEDKSIYLNYIAEGKFNTENFDFKLKDVWRIHTILHMMSLSPQYTQDVYKAAITCIQNHTKCNYKALPDEFFMHLLWYSWQGKKLFEAAAKNPYTYDLVTLALEKGAPSEQEFYALRYSHKTLHPFHSEIVAACTEWKKIKDSHEKRVR